MSQRLRVLVVDDSAFMRGAVSRMLAADARFEVVGQAKDGEEAVRLAGELAPDVISMDFNMPGLNGAEATRAILAKRATPIVMLSAHTREGATAAVQALAAGAVDFVEKPDGEVSANLNTVKDQLVEKLIAAAGANVRGSMAVAEVAPSEAPMSRRSPRSPPRAMPAGLRVVVIASSTGGPAALFRLLPSLTSAGKAAIVIVQHMSAGFTEALADQLAEQAGYQVREAKQGDVLEAGVALVAPGGMHLVLERNGTVSVNDGPLVHGVRPAADVTLKSAAQIYGARSVGVVLTGMGRDGALGLAAIKAAGGRTFAQDKATCTVFGMPKAAVEMGVVDEVLPLDQIGRSVSRLVST
ncbi:MAG: chemotaxis response regulator protein-glutamate methylesterase [Myxococcales bacterium]|nr:chemotaxis response regulator protein-glutamate methylesterase [Myxococcales bacterium]